MPELPRLALEALLLLSLTVLVLRPERFVRRVTSEAFARLAEQLGGDEAVARRLVAHERKDEPSLDEARAAERALRRLMRDRRR